jgi:hypothetical protein
MKWLDKEGNRWEATLNGRPLRMLTIMTTRGSLTSIMVTITRVTTNMCVLFAVESDTHKRALIC